MSKIKINNNWVFVVFCAFGLSAILSVIINNSAFAADSGIIENGDARWEYELTDAPQELSIKFYDKTPSATTVTVPSLAWLKSNVPGVSADLNTYFLKDADQTAQDANYSPTPARRTATANTTVLDMTSTNKIQILGVSPIIDPEIQTELKFGQEMVIGDTPTKVINASLCTNWRFYDWGSTWGYNCTATSTIHPDVSSISGWNDMTIDEKINYEPTPADFNCTNVNSDWVYSWDSEPIVVGQCYYTSFSQSTTFIGSAFSGYNLKLTNFNASNFNYVGYRAFANSTLADTSITIDGNSLKGGEIFAGTNVKNITINTNNYGTGLFKDCQHIQSVTFGDNTDIIMADTFAGTNLMSIDLSGVKRIGARAFEGARFEEVDLTGVERLDYRAFKDNDIKELYLPKSINYLEAEAFKGNGNMKKLTVAYDTLTSGTILPLWVVLSNDYSKGNNDTNGSIEEINVIAPYAANEQVSATHLTMDDYVYHYDADFNYHAEEVSHFGTGSGIGDVMDTNYWRNKTRAHQTGTGAWESQKQATEPEKRWAKPDEKKNVIAPLYFSYIFGIKKINIGDGYEYIGASAFFDGSYATYGWDETQDMIEDCQVNDLSCTSRYLRPIESVRLPESLKGVGELALSGIYHPNLQFNIPSGIEYIGQGAFINVAATFDVNFPNLKFLGDHAFRGSFVRDIYLHDTLEYMGWSVFAMCYKIHDITFDLDIFDPNNLIIWPKVLYDDDLWIERYGSWSTNQGNWYESEFNAAFGAVSSDYDVGSTAAAEWNLPQSELGSTWNGSQKFGKITFTEKAIHEPEIPAVHPNYSVGGCSLTDDRLLGGSCACFFFGGIRADELDLSATPWKVLRPFLFLQMKVGKLELPSNTEVIGTHALDSVMIAEELTLPSTLKIIGASAFHSYGSGNYSPIITSLPSGLEYIGEGAFAYDKNLHADLNAPNLKRLGVAAFYDADLRDVLIPSTLEWLAPGTFFNNPSLRDIIIDADFASLVAAPQETADTYRDWPSSMAEYANGQYSPYKLVENTYYTVSNQYGANEFETFFTYFSQHGRRKEEIYHDYGDWGYTSVNYYDIEQLDSGDNYGSLVFTDKNVTELDGTTGIFSGLSFGTIDMSATNWTKITKQPYAFNQANIGTLILPSGLKTVTEGAFFDAEIENEFALPTSTTTIDRVAFQGATGTITNALPEGLTTINEAAFYEADMADNLVIPSTVTHIGESAFNTGSKDIYYDSITVKPSLTFDSTEDQLIHQIFWGADLGKLVIESSTLPALAKDPDLPFQQEFWSMPMSEVVLKNLTGISHSAFEGCTNLKKVDATGDPDLVLIGEQAFINDELLDTFLFASGSKNKVITVKSNAFQGTAFTELGDSSSSFDLTAAKFDATPGHSFANMPKLKKVTVPRNFSGSTIPEYTFYNDALLEEAIVDYKITDIKNAAFAKDDNLKRIFIWGDTIVQDQSLDGYTAPTRGPSPTVVGPTIPAGTDIYAYSTAKTEAYAASEQREDFEGKFYPLDEVLYLTSNHPTVLLNEDDTDFDKSDLTVYAMRRDGIILESDSWQEFDGNAYARAGKGLTFEHMAETIAENEAFGTVWDTPVPLNELDLSNQNFANLAYSIRPATDDPAVLTVDLIHPDRYTAYLANTNVDPRDYVPEPIPDPTPDPIPTPEPETPKTLDGIAKSVALFAGSSVAVAAIYFVVRRRR